MPILTVSQNPDVADSFYPSQVSCNDDATPDQVQS